MNRWPAGPMLGFDTETTGVDVATDRIVSAALVHRGPLGTWVRTWLIDPGVAIPAAAAAVHGISTERARAEGTDPATALGEIAARISEAQREGVPVVAYNAPFDLTLLENELARYRLPTLAQRLGRPPGPVLDPLVLDRHVAGSLPGPRRLGDLCERYGVATGELHTAEVDVVATLDLLVAMAALHPRLAAASPADLHALQVSAHKTWARSHHRWRARAGLPRPGAEHGWPLPERPTRWTRLVRGAAWSLGRLLGLPKRWRRRRGGRVSG